MALRQDTVQLKVEFITDENRRLSATLLETKKYSDAIAESTAKMKNYQKELVKVGDDESKRVIVLQKIAKEEAVVAKNLTSIVTEGKKVEALDLNKIAPAQLIQRAKQLQQAIKMIPASAPEYRQLESELGRVNAQMRDLNTRSKGLNDQVKGGGGFFSQFLGGSGGLGSLAKITGAVGVLYGAISSVSGIVRAARETEKLFAVLKNGLGSEQVALVVFKELQAFAAETPFALNEVVGAFNKLQQRNFNPTIEQLRTMGDIAASSGKDIDQFVEAILDAQTGEFERLKEFGVVARKNGDDVRVSFRGQSETFKNTAENLNEYLLGLGKLPGIAGATAAVAATLDGALSNAGDNLDRLAAQVGSGGGFFKGVVDGFNSWLDLINEYLDVPLSESIAQEQSEFNALVAILQDVNASEATRNLAINELQAKYPDYVGNINLEKATQSELNGILQAGNEAFEKRIFLQQNEENLVGFAKRRVDAERGIFSLQKDLNALNQKGELGFFDSIQKDRIERSLALSRGFIEKTKTDQETFIKEQEQISERLFGTKTPPAANKPSGGEGGGGGGEDAAAREKQLALRIKGIEVGVQKQELILENQRIKGAVDEEEYNNRLIAIAEDGLTRKLDVYRRFGELQSIDALKAANELALIEQGRGLQRIAIDIIKPLAIGPLQGPAAAPGEQTDQALGVQQLGEDARANVLKTKFETLLITEQEYNLQRAELQRLALLEELAILKDGGEQYAEQVRLKGVAVMRIEEDISAQKTALAQREEDFKSDVAQAGFQASVQLFGLATELLEADEKGRKDNATAIKAFQSAEVITSGLLEAQRSYEGALKTFGVPAGNIIGGVLAGIAVGRSFLAANKIRSTKFAGGGYTGDGQGAPDSTGFRPAGIVHEGEYVSPKWQVQDAETGPVVAWLNQRRLRGYAEGGFVAPDTTPQSAPNQSGQAQAASFQQAEAFTRSVEQFTRTVAAFPTEVRSRVVYLDIEEAGNTINRVREEAGI